METGPPKSIVIVVACADNGVIGRDGGLPWHLPADLKHFKTVTMGAPMIMGRRTFESLPGRLPGRRHIVLTRNLNWQADGAEVARSLDQSLAMAAADRVSIIGGAEIFRLFEPVATGVELTEVHIRPEGDVVIPPFDPRHWREVSRDNNEPEGDRPAFDFVTLRRRS